MYTYVVYIYICVCVRNHLPNNIEYCSYVSVGGWGILTPFMAMLFECHGMGSNDHRIHWVSSPQLSPKYPIRIANSKKN